MKHVRNLLLAALLIPALAFAQFTVNAPAPTITSSARQNAMPAGKIFLDPQTIPPRRDSYKTERPFLSCVGTIAFCATQGGGPNQGPTSTISTDEDYQKDRGDFREGCALSHVGFDDPIVFPGEAGRTHAHQFFGNTQTNAFSSGDFSLFGNSTCQGGLLNRTGYWAPVFVAHCPAGSTDGCVAAFAAAGIADGKVYVANDANFYYKCPLGFSCTTASDQSVATTNPTKCPTPQRLPPSAEALGCPEQWPAIGFRMIAGSATNKINWAGGNSFNQPYGYTCASDTFLANTAPNKHHIWTAAELTAYGFECQTMTFSVNFPMCWDGVNIDSPGTHNAHMSGNINVDGIIGGDKYYTGCRGNTAFPVAIPPIQLQLRVYGVPNSIWPYMRLSSDVPKAEAIANAGNAAWPCATDANNWCAGVTAHSDWWNGWSHQPLSQFGNQTITQIIQTKCHSLNHSPTGYHSDCHNGLLGNPNNDDQFWKID